MCMCLCMWVLMHVHVQFCQYDDARLPSRCDGARSAWFRSLRHAASLAPRTYSSNAEADSLNSKRAPRCRTSSFSDDSRSEASESAVHFTATMAPPSDSDLASTEPPMSGGLVGVAHRIVLVGARGHGVLVPVGKNLVAPLQCHVDSQHLVRLESENCLTRF